MRTAMKKLAPRLVIATLCVGTGIGAVAAWRSFHHPSTFPSHAGASLSHHPPIEPGWVEVGFEDFQRLIFTTPPTWKSDHPDSSSRFSDDGAFFHEREPDFSPPKGYRISVPFGPNGFLTLEVYSLKKKSIQQLARIVTDPSEPGNPVLRLASPEHTDGNIIRTTQPLGNRYRIWARIGYMQFGTGDGLNGCQGDEENGPWLHGDAFEENGFYFGALYRSVPQPHNNLWAHHERLLFIDSDNNTEGWTSIYDPKTGEFRHNGRHPIVIGAIDNRDNEMDEEGPRFLSYSGGSWQGHQTIRAVDAYKENTWYTVCLTRFDDQLTLTISGDFQYGGRTTYEIKIDNTNAIPYFNRPHYWLLGDPHINYYEGSLLVDDISLMVWRQEGTNP